MDIVRKAHQWANMIHCCFVSRNVNLLVHAFTVYEGRQKVLQLDMTV